MSYMHLRQQYAAKIFLQIANIPFIHFNSARFPAIQLFDLEPVPGSFFKRKSAILKWCYSFHGSTLVSYHRAAAEEAGEPVTWTDPHSSKFVIYSLQQDIVYGLKRSGRYRIYQ